MKSRGLTMIEMLLALVLLSAIVAAAASWTALAGRLAVSTAGPTQVRLVADSTLALIQDDLVSGDFDQKPSASSPSTTNQLPRCRTQDGALEIDTRAGHTLVYCLNRSERVFERSERSQNSSPARRLVSDVKDFTCTIDEAQRSLVVTLATDGASTASFTRRYTLP